MLRHHRKEAGLRPEQVAVHVDRSAHKVYEWETNKRAPSLKQLAQLAELFGVTAAELLEAASPCGDA